MDIKTFARELVADFKKMYPEYFKNENELIPQMVGAISLIASLAIEKHERESHPKHNPQSL